MAFPVTLNGRTYTLADFQGLNYVEGFPDALEDFVTQAGDIYNTTSTTSTTIEVASKTFTVADSGKPYVVGTPLRAASQADPDNFLDGIVTSYTGTTLVLDVKNIGGSGTFADWNITIGGGLAQVTLTGTIAINEGGTGATTAAQARTNLEVPNIAGDTFTGDVTVSGELIADSYNEEHNAVTSSSNATTIDCETGNVFSIDLDENTTFTFSNPPASGTAYGFTLKVTQVSPGAFTTTWPASVYWAGGTAPTLTGTTASVDVFAFFTHDGGTTWYGFTAGQDLQ